TSRWSERRTASRTACSARSACSGRCGWTTTRRSAPCAAPPTSSLASSRRSTRTTEAGATLSVVSTTERDYYELLGVTRDAGPEDIKRAFRRLARELHPDVSDAPDAEQRFREVVEAYEVLSNAERRELYDRFGHAGLRSGGFNPTTFDLGGLSDLFAAIFGDDLFGVAGRAGRARGADLARPVGEDVAHG